MSIVNYVHNYNKAPACKPQLAFSVSFINLPAKRKEKKKT